ncbi:MAG: hypothetical protein AB3N14_03785 [Flavobacteriaceae bacterium]
MTASKPTKQKSTSPELIWDEYKYRHDLIWRHVIRSTLAVIGSISLLFSKDSNFNIAILGIPFYVFLSLGLVIYVLMTIAVLYKELQLFSKIKWIHRDFQNGHMKIYDIASAPPSKDDLKLTKMLSGEGFNRRVLLHVFLLLLISLVVFLYLTLGKDEVTATEGLRNFPFSL